MLPLEELYKKTNMIPLQNVKTHIPDKPKVLLKDVNLSLSLSRT